MSTMTDWDPWDRNLRMEPGPGPEPGTIDDPSALDPEEWLALRPYRHRDYGPLLEPTVLAPTCLFDPRGSGPPKNSGPKDAHEDAGLRTRLARMSCGWRTAATVEAFLEALEATKKESKHRRLLSAWLTETTRDEIADSLRAGTFTMRKLATALHTQKVDTGHNVQLVNVWAKRSNLQHHDP